MIDLGVNIDHVATLRQARGTSYPEPAQAVVIAEQSGADLITLHLREDRRHIVDRDVYLLKQIIQTRMNLEMAATEEMVRIACDVQPEDVCIVPEKREELTTEGGLDVVGQEGKIKDACQRMADAGIQVSLFIDADEKQIDALLKRDQEISNLPFPIRYNDKTVIKKKLKTLFKLVCTLLMVIEVLGQLEVFFMEVQIIQNMQMMRYLNLQ